MDAHPTQDSWGIRSLDSLECSKLPTKHFKLHYMHQEALHQLIHKFGKHSYQLRSQLESHRLRKGI
jgi:hypothetical protein